MKNSLPQINDLVPSITELRNAAVCADPGDIDAAKALLMQAETVAARLQGHVHRLENMKEAA